MAQGVADFGGALLVGAPLFGFTQAVAAWGGAPALFAAIFLHNLGLACLVPGVGFVAATRERTPKGRRLLGRILLAALVAAMGMGLVYVLAGPGEFDLGVALPILAAEAAAVLYVAVVAHAQFARFEDGANEAALASALARVRRPLAYAAVALAVLAAAETLIVWA